MAARVMQPQEKPTGKSKNSEHNRYCCSNPNCKKVFSKPKIIKYYVCPSCQTVIDMPFEDSPLIAREKPVLEKKIVAPENQKESNQDEKLQLMKSLRMQVSELILELEAIMDQPSTGQLTTDQQSTTDNELALMEKPEEKEIVEEEEQLTSQQATADDELTLRKNPEAWIRIVEDLAKKKVAVVLRFE